MCKLCDAGQPQNHLGSRRNFLSNFLKGTVATGVAAAGLNLFAARPAAADDPPMDSGRPGRQSGRTYSWALLAAFFCALNHVGYKLALAAGATPWAVYATAMTVATSLTWATADPARGRYR